MLSSWSPSVKILVYSKWKTLCLQSGNWPSGDVHLIRICRCHGCSTTYLEDGDQVIKPVDVEDVHDAYEGLQDDDLNNSKQELLHDDAGWLEKFTSVLCLVEQGVNGPTSINRSIDTNSSHNQTLNYEDKKLETADCSKRRAALCNSARAATSSAHTDNVQSYRDPRSQLPSHHQKFANQIASL